MTSGRLRPPARPADSVSVRPLRSEAEWEQAVENQVVCREPEFGEAGYRLFRQRQMARYRQMAAADLGDWFGAFIGQRLVADLGVFKEGEIGRFQAVETHPDFRRRGIGGTLVFEAGRQAMASYELDTLVIVAEEDGSAARLYHSLGFEAVEKQVGMAWWTE